MTEEIPQLREGIADIKDLSFTDIFILQYLRRFKGSTIRITLLETLNAFMQPGEEMSPSSFYNRLKRLKKKGFIAEDNERTRGQKISITPLAIQALSRINELTMISSIDFYEYTEKTLPQIMQDIPEVAEKSENLLIINLEVGLDMETLNLICQFAKTSYIATDDITYDRYLGRGLPPQVHQSPVIESTIREPDAWFERILIIGLDCVGDVDDVQVWIDESYRLLKPGGLFLITTLSEFPKTNHFVLDHLANDITDNDFVHVANTEKLEYAFDSSGFENIRSKDYSGLLLAWASKT